MFWDFSRFQTWTPLSKHRKISMGQHYSYELHDASTLAYCQFTKKFFEAIHTMKNTVSMEIQLKWIMYWIWHDNFSKSKVNWKITSRKNDGKQDNGESIEALKEPLKSSSSSSCIVISWQGRKGIFFVS